MVVRSSTDPTLASPHGGGLLVGEWRVVAGAPAVRCGGGALPADDWFPAGPAPPPRRAGSGGPRSRGHGAHATPPSPVDIELIPACNHFPWIRRPWSGLRSRRIRGSSPPRAAEEPTFPGLANLFGGHNIRGASSPEVQCTCVYTI